MLTRSDARLVRTTRGGFTLLEVLVVTAILLILASLATFGVIRYMEQAKRSEAKLQMGKIEQAVKTYYLNNGDYPQSLSELIVPEPGLPPLLDGGEAAITDPWGQPYTHDVVTDNYGSPRVVIYSNGSGVEIMWPQK